MMEMNHRTMVARSEDRERQVGVLKRTRESCEMVQVSIFIMVKGYRKLHI